MYIYIYMFLLCVNVFNACCLHMLLLLMPPVIYVVLVTAIVCFVSYACLMRRVCIEIMDGVLCAH